jgi:hypothetical protein
MTVYPEQTWISWLDDLFGIGNINISIKIRNGNQIRQNEYLSIKMERYYGIKYLLK